MCLIGGSPGSGASPLCASQDGCSWRIDPRVFLASEGPSCKPQPLWRWGECLVTGGSQGQAQTWQRASVEWMTKALLEAMWLDGGPIGTELKSPGAKDGVKWREDSGGPWCQTWPVWWGG